MGKILTIAEIGHNHNGNMKLAKQMIWRAKTCGADIAKFQLYDIDYIMKTTDEHYQELKDSQLTKDQLALLYRECQEAEIEFLTSVFDAERVGWTEELGMKRYKIASRSVYDRELISAVEKTGKDVICSLGMWKGKELPRIETKGKVDFLFCVSKYPTRDEDLKNFYSLDFKTYSGFSDHTIGIQWAIVAMVLGAKIIEKHFTLDKNMVGCDQAGSANPYELGQLIACAGRIEGIR